MKKYIILFILLLTANNISATDRYWINTAEVEINEHGICKKVKATDSFIHFVPVKYKTEWESFLGNIPAGISIQQCAISVPAVVLTNSATSIGQGSATLNGTLTINDSASETVSFKYGTSASALNNSVNVGTRTSSGSFATQVSGLNSGTTYYFRAMTYPGDETGSVQSFTTSAPASTATVVTQYATEITGSCARLNGYLYLNGTSSSAVSFKYGTSASALNNSVNAGTKYSSTSFSKLVCGLTTGATYYFKSISDSGNSGNTKNFTATTTPPPPSNTPAEVTTNSATNVQKTSANLLGYLTINDSASETVSFKYGTSASALNNSVNVGTRTSSGSFATQVSGLNSGTTYYFRAMTYPGDETGSVQSFTTSASVQPQVTTDSATNVGQNSAILNGSLMINDSTSENVGFKYKSPTGSYISASAGSMSSSGSFSKQITGLQPETVYSFKATTSSGNDGNVQTFTTTQVPITVTTVSATPEGNCITLNGNLNTGPSSPVSVGFNYGKGSLANLSAGSAAAPNSFSSQVCNLTNGTYSYQAKAGSVVGSTKTFIIRSGVAVPGVDCPRYVCNATGTDCILEVCP